MSRLQGFQTRAASHQCRIGFGFQKSTLILVTHPHHSGYNVYRSLKRQVARQPVRFGRSEVMPELRPSGALMAS